MASYDQHITTRAVRAYQERPASVKQARQATVEVRVDDAALESAVRPLGVADVQHESARGAALA